MTTPPAKAQTQTQNPYNRPSVGAGADFVAAANSPEEQIRHWIFGENYPRIVIDLTNFQILAGNGQSLPQPVGGGGAASAAIVAQAKTYTDSAINTATISLLGAMDNKIATALGTGATSPPGQPLITTLTPTSQQVSVAFTTPANGGSAILDYTLTVYAIIGGQVVASSVAPVTGASSPLVATGLVDGTIYVARVAARNVVGTGNQSPNSQNFSPPATVPDAPTNVTAASTGTQVQAFFTPGANQGSPITSFLVTATSSDGGTTRSASGGATGIIVTNLTAGKTYRIAVTATNSVGTSAASAASAAFVVGTIATTTAAFDTLGMFVGEPNIDGIRNIKSYQSILGRPLRCVQMNLGVTSDFALDNIWGCCADVAGVSTDGSHCLTYDGTIRTQIRGILDIPLAFGTPTQGYGNGYGLSAAQKIQQLAFVAAGTTDGSHNATGSYIFLARNYYRDRGISTTVAAGSNGVDITTFVGAGTLNVATTTADPSGNTAYPFAASSAAAGHALFVTTAGGVGLVSYTGKSGTTFTGCTYLGRAGVGGGSGALTVTTGSYVGSGTGFPDFWGRPGWEFDGNWFPWGATKPATYWNGGPVEIVDNTATQAALSAQFVLTYKAVNNVLRAIGWDTYRADLTGDPAGWFDQRKTDVADVLSAANTADGAAKHVQIYGLDVYDQDTTNGYNATTKTWSDQPAAWAKMRAYLQTHHDAAVAAGCALSYIEWSGVSDKPDGSPCGGDNPVFVQGFFDWCNTMTAGFGAGQLAGTCNFASNNEGGNFSFQTNKPLAYAKFKHLYGVGL